MANTYTQIHLQIVFAVKNRECLIPKEHREELHKYITGICSHLNQKMLAVFARPDHAHMLVGLRPNIALSDFVRDIKAGSSRFINDKRWCRSQFHWQTGFGAFSYARKDVENVIQYILNQDEHHKHETFKEEFIQLFKVFGIDYDEKYLFEDVMIG